jgi:hypothetical protein
MGEVLLGPQVWRPSWTSADDRPEIGWRPAGVVERDLFEGKLAIYNALPVYPWNIAEQFRAGLSALLPNQPEDAERLDQIRERTVNGATDIDPVEASDLAEATTALMKYWPGYRDLVGQAANREAVMPVMAFREFVTGWKNVRASDGKTVIELQRGLDGLITQECLREVDPLMIRACGIAIYNGMFPGGLEKNSAPPSPSDDAPKTSKGTTPKGGKSTKTTGEKTPS